VLKKVFNLRAVTTSFIKTPWFHTFQFLSVSWTEFHSEIHFQQDFHQLVHLKQIYRLVHMPHWKLVAAWTWVLRCVRLMVVLQKKIGYWTTGCTHGWSFMGWFNFDGLQVEMIRTVYHSLVQCWGPCAREIQGDPGRSCLTPQADLDRLISQISIMIPVVAATIQRLMCQRVQPLLDYVIKN